jgi:hypothetical protein
VKAMIEAANRIRHRPYVWGGGDRSEPGWSEEMRSTGGFRLRHPLGLLQATPLS